MALHKVTTLVQFKHTYWIEADKLEDAQLEVGLRDVNDENFFEEASQEYIGETIIDSETLKYKHFTKWLEREKGRKEPWVAHWLGDKLIHTVDYSPINIEFVESDEDHTSRQVFKSMGSILIMGRPDVE